jgi:hypothetical protein
MHNTIGFSDQPNNNNHDMTPAYQVMDSAIESKAFPAC